MKIESVPACRHRDDDELKLAVVVKDTSLTVAGVARVLSDDEGYAVSIPDKGIAMTITGYLVVEKASSKARLLVDEVPADGTPPFRFAGSDFELLTQLFVIQVPANTPDLGAVTCSVHTLSPIVPKPTTKAIPIVKPAQPAGRK